MASAADRDEVIRSLRAGGGTLQQIADQVGLTRERVRQILVNTDGPTAAEVRIRRESDRAALAAATANRIRADIESHPGSSAEEVAQRLALSKQQVTRHLPDDLRRLLVSSADWTEEVWSDDDILELVRRTGTYGYPVSAQTYDDLLRAGELTGPSVARIAQRFGNWGEACRRAGVEPAPPRRDNYQSRWTDEDMLGFVRDYLRAPESPGSFAGYDPWRRQHAPSAPSSALMRTRLGHWSHVKRKALEP